MLRWDPGPCVRCVTVLRVCVLCTVICNAARPHTPLPVTHGDGDGESWKCMMFLFDWRHRAFFSLIFWSEFESSSRLSAQLFSSPRLSRVLSRILVVIPTTRETLRSALRSKHREPDHNSSWHQWMANYAVMLSTDTWRAVSVMNGFNMPLDYCKQKTMEYLISRGWMLVLSAFW